MYCSLLFHGRLMNGTCVTINPLTLFSMVKCNILKSSLRNSKSKLIIAEKPLLCFDWTVKKQL